jgi:hypothetical protein
MRLSPRISRHLLAAGIAATVTGLMSHAAHAEQVGGITISGTLLLSPNDWNFTKGVALTGDTSLPDDSLTMGSAPNDLDITYLLLGDADLVGSVSNSDLELLMAKFNKEVIDGDEGNFDFSNNLVNGLDFGDLATSFNKGTSSADSIAALDAFALANGLEADVPEPASTAAIALVGILALAVVPRRLVGRRA